MNIYEPKGRAREYSPLALNYMSGCSHNCDYCYVPNMLCRFNKSYNHSNCVSPKQNSIDIIEKSAKKYEKCNNQILLCFTGDPYCNESVDFTYNVLNVLNKYRHKVAILTKGGNNILKHADLFKKFEDRIKIGATLTFDNESDSLNYESGAASPNERISSLKKISELGVKTWASFEPVIIPEQSLNLIEKIEFIDHVKIGKINNYKGIDKSIDWNLFLKDSVNLCRCMNIKFYIKKDLQLYNNNSVYLNENEINMDYLNL